MKNYVAYYRVSTEEQGKSGLGLEAQRRSVEDFITSNGKLVAEYTDIESGASNSRHGIKSAIVSCERHGATLVVKEMSRISRGGFKIMVELEEKGVNFVEATSPHDNATVKGIKFVLAKEEREKISTRTKDALMEIKRKIRVGELHTSKAGNIVTSLGSPDNLTKLSRDKSIEVRQKNALEDSNNIKATTFIVDMMAEGSNFRQITIKLNRYGFKTSRGNDFSEVQTKRLYDRVVSNLDIN